MQEKCTFSYVLQDSNDDNKKILQMMMIIVQILQMMMIIEVLHPIIEKK